MRLLIAAGGRADTSTRRSPSPGRSARVRTRPSCAGSAATAASRRRSSRRPASRCAGSRRARCGRPTLDVHAVLDPIRLGVSVPQAAAILAAERPAAIFTTGGYVAIPVLMAAAPLRIPVVLWDGNVIPGRAVRATARLADVARGLVRGHLRGARRRRAGPALLRHRHADPRHRASRPRRGPAAARTSPPGERVLLVFGGSQAVRRFNAAVAEALPRLVERVTVIHVTGDDGYAGRAGRPRGAARGRPRAATARTRSCATRCCAALAAADLVVGRAGSSTLAEVTALGLPMVVVPYPHAAGHQRANAREPGRGRRGAADRGRGLRRRGARSTRPRLLDDPATHAAMSAAARSLGRPGAADAVAELVLAAADAAGRCRTRPRSNAASRGSGGMTARASTPIATGTDIQRRIGVKTSRDEPLARFTTMRVGGPADLFATRPQRLRAARPRPVRARRATCRTSSSGGGATWSSPTPACAGWSSRTAPRARGSTATRYIADAGRADGPRRDRDAARRADRARVRAGDPGHGRRGRVGQRRRPRGGRRGGPRVRARARRRRHARRSSRRPSSALGYRDSRFKHARAGCSRPSSIVEATFRLAPADPDTIKARLDEIRRWRQAHQPLGLPSAGSVFRNPHGRLGRAADRRGRAQGPADRRRRRVREARQLHRQRPEGDRRATSAGWPSTSAPRSLAGDGVELALRDRVRRRLDRLGAGA